MYYLNNNIKRLNRIFDQNDRSAYLRLDLNENPGGLPRETIKSILNNVSPRLVAEYPETLDFTKKLAKLLKSDVSHICLVNGSAEGIRYIIQTFTSPGGRIVGVIPSYFMFQVYSKMYGRKFVGVPYSRDLSMDAKNIINAITNDTQLLILLNPNNPMGNVYSENEFKEMLRAAKKHKVTILIDEAYHYFYPKTFIKYALNEQHVFVTRTFSKLWSMAGCRLGYVVGWPEGIKMIQKMCTPHNVNAFALLFADYIIDHPKILTKLIENYNDGRNYLIDTLNKYHYQYKGEAGNFLFIKPKTDANQIVKNMKAKKKILIKSYPKVGKLGNCLRVTIGEKKYMQIFTKALLELDR